MILFKCKHPFAALGLYSGPKEISRDHDFINHEMTLYCDRCKERLPVRWASFLGGVDAFIERGSLKTTPKETP